MNAWVESILWCDIVKSIDKVGQSLGIVFSGKKILVS